MPLNELKCNIDVIYQLVSGGNTPALLARRRSIALIFPARRAGILARAGSPALSRHAFPVSLGFMVRPFLLSPVAQLSALTITAVKLA